MNKRVIKFLIIFLIIFIITSGGLSVYFCYFHRYKGNDIIDIWNKDDVFNINNIVTLEKEKDKEFKILNLTDIQMCDIEDFFNRKIIKKEIDYLIKTTNPDLITLTGDQTWSNENLMSLKCLIRWLDSYKIPYAPIFGNHDYGNDYNSSVASLNYCCDLYENGKYSLFKRGPSNLGCLGNYVINIMEDGKIYSTLYMIDAGYNDSITNNQIEWIQWNAEGIKKSNNDEYSLGMCFMHKPIDEFADAYYSYIRGDSISYTKVLVNCSLYGIDGNGLYDICKTCNIKYFTCGHQHTNSFSINYDNSVFTFALKTGELSFYYDDGETNYNGGTLFTLSDDIKINNIYVDRDEFHIKGSTNNYNK